MATYMSNHENINKKNIKTISWCLILHVNHDGRSVNSIYALHVALSL